ncbi:hypothetical protein SCARD494_00636 [Seiridium cardinale]
MMPTVGLTGALLVTLLDAVVTFNKRDSDVRMFRRLSPMHSASFTMLCGAHLESCNMVRNAATPLAWYSLNVPSMDTNSSPKPTADFFRSNVRVMHVLQPPWTLDSTISPSICFSAAGAMQPYSSGC